MFRVLLLFLPLFTDFSVVAQEDDQPLKNDVLKGTVILPYTHNYLSILNAGYHPDKVEKADCSDHGESVYSEKDKIDRVVFTDSTIEIHLRIYDNCCYEFLWNPYLSDDGVLDLKYTGYGDYCGCNCCFGHVITFKKDFEPDEKTIIHEIRINGEGSHKINPPPK